jgi:hypothetical protein
MSRHFRALRTITLPQGLIAGPGATNMRLDPGAVVTCDDAACVRQQRFINGRLRERDLEELDSVPDGAPEPKTVPSAERAPEGKFGMTVAEPKKER